MIEAAEYARVIASWQGVPYSHEGRTRTACDCVGLIVGSLKEAGALPEHVKPRTRYSKRPQQQLVAELEKHCEPRPLNLGPEVGGLVSIRWKFGQAPGHLAVVVPAPPGVPDLPLYICHAYIQSGRVTLSSYSGGWVRRTVGFWRLPGVRY